MKVLVVSGIWPPDVGGPASHAPEVAEFLAARGHEVQVAITAEGAPPLEDYPVHWVSRSRPPGVRHADTVRLLTSLSRWADVVYTTGMLGRSSLGSLLGRTPFVTKLTADPAYERARRWGIANGSLEESMLTRAGVTPVAGHRVSTSGVPRTSSPRRRTCGSWRSAGASARAG